MPTVDTSSTYHIAFADDANSGNIVGDSFHWLFKDEPIGLEYNTGCEGGNSSSQCSLSGHSDYNYYTFSSSRDYFKPQHCYGRTSIDRIYKKDTSGKIRVDEKGNKIPDKGFSEKPIDHLQGQYPRHWRRQIATYKQDQPWEALTADTASMAKISIYEKKVGSNDAFNPSHRTDDGNKVSSATTNYNNAYIYFPDNGGGSSQYKAYPFFHYLSPENCKFDNDNEKTAYHRDSASTLTNYEGGGSGKTYAYNMSIGASGSPMTQDCGPYYLTYSGVMTYGNEYCTWTQKTKYIKYIGEATNYTVLNNVILYDDVDNYLNGYGAEPARKTGFFSYSSWVYPSEFSKVLPYDSSKSTSNTFGYYDYQSISKYTTISNDANMPNTKEGWKKLLEDNTIWNSSGNYFFENDGNYVLERFNKDATVPYQKTSFYFDTNASVEAYIYGGLTDVTSCSVSGNRVDVTIDYGENYKGSAHTGGVIVKDNHGHRLDFPIDEYETITMAEARELAANGYGAINDKENYWCRTDGQGDKGKEFVNS